MRSDYLKIPEYLLEIRNLSMEIQYTNEKEQINYLAECIRVRAELITRSLRHLTGPPVSFQKEKVSGPGYDPEEPI